MLAGTGNSSSAAGAMTYDQLRTEYADLGELKGERSLVTLNTRTGQILTNTLEDPASTWANVNQPSSVASAGCAGGA